MLGKLYEARKNTRGGDRGNQYTKKVASAQNGHMTKLRVLEQIAKEQGKFTTNPKNEDLRQSAHFIKRKW